MMEAMSPVYIENIGMAFVGIGVMVMCFVMSYFIYQFTRGIRASVDYDERYMALKHGLLNRLASKRNINLSDELKTLAKDRISTQMFKKTSFRKKLEKEMLEDLFGKEKEKKEK